MQYLSRGLRYIQAHLQVQKLVHGLCYIEASYADDVVMYLVTVKRVPRIEVVLTESTGSRRAS